MASCSLSCIDLNNPAGTDRHNKDRPFVPPVRHGTVYPLFIRGNRFFGEEYLYNTRKAASVNPAGGSGALGPGIKTSLMDEDLR